MTAAIINEPAMTKMTNAAAIGGKSRTLDMHVGQGEPEHRSYQMRLAYAAATGNAKLMRPV
jgi:hypothetical protein